MFKDLILDIVNYSAIFWSHYGFSQFKEVHFEFPVDGFFVINPSIFIVLMLVVLHVHISQTFLGHHKLEMQGTICFDIT